MDLKTFNQQRGDRHCGTGSKSEENNSNDSEFPSMGESAVDPLSSISSRNKKAFEVPVLPEEATLVKKLTIEIGQLEAWLASQQNTAQGSVSVIPTIKSLIHTRKKLLKNIQTQH